MTISILFVDDEPNVLKGLKRTFYSMRSEWKMFYALSGSQALKIISENEIDLLVSDMYMPEMDGAELLRQVQSKYPHVIRIILSGHSDIKLILKTLFPAHKFLNKPCSQEQLINTVKRILLAQKLLPHQEIRTEINEIGALPSQPFFFPVMQQALDQQDMKMISRVIFYDVGMIANILKVTVNSFFGEMDHLPTIEEAVNMLGTDVLNNLFNSNGYLATYEDFIVPELSVDRLWRHCLRTAKFAAAIARQEDQDSNTVHHCFIAGLLHDIGKYILIYKYFDSYRELLQKMEKLNIDAAQAELEHFNTTHGAVGAYLMSLWGIPYDIIEAMAFHSKPSLLKHTGFSPLAAVHTANVFEHYFCYLRQDHLQRELDVTYLRQTGLENRLPQIKETCKKIYQSELSEQKQLLF